MKITKKRLQEIVLEEMRTLKEYTGSATKTDTPETDTPETETEEKFTRQTAIAGEREGGSATDRARRASSVTAREGALLSIIQALRAEIGEPGELEDVSGVTRDLMRGLGKARKQ